MILRPELSTIVGELNKKADGSSFALCPTQNYKGILRLVKPFDVVYDFVSNYHGRERAMFSLVDSAVSDSPRISPKYIYGRALVSSYFEGHHNSEKVNNMAFRVVRPINLASGEVLNSLQLDFVTLGSYNTAVEKYRLVAVVSGEVKVGGSDHNSWDENGINRGKNLTGILGDLFG